MDDTKVIRIPAKAPGKANIKDLPKAVPQPDKAKPADVISLEPVRKIKFRQGQSPGDILTFANAVGDLKRTYPNWLIDVDSPAPELWLYNPHLTPLDKDSSDVEYYDITYDDINISGWNGLHFTDAFRNDIEKKLNLEKIGVVSGEAQEELKQRLVHSSIRDLCANANLELSDKAVATHTAFPNRWNILDPVNAHMLEVRSENNELVVYDAAPERVKRWGHVTITKHGMKPELHLSDEEKSWWGQVHCETFWDGPYWVINAGRKPDNELKQYHRWSEVATLFNERFQGRVKLVQMGHPDHIHPPLEGAINLIGKTDLRQLVRLVHWSHGTIGPLSFQFVMSAAFEQPSVCVAAGKEGVKWHLYPHIRYMYTNGALNCCVWDGCWLGGAGGKCKDIVDVDGSPVPRCFTLIEPKAIVDAVAMYYEGGRLQIPSDEDIEKWTKKIFILEDDPQRQEAFRLKYVHHNVTIASTARDACVILAEEQFDVISLDGHLSPENVSKTESLINSGSTVTRFLAERKPQHHAHVIAHCNAGWGLSHMLKYLPDIDHRPESWR